ncbi:GNAT family N-acetyltransferase [Actinocorallia aurantiaca]|uniref:GNAT family N-acetyltransferase n=1 Tax=Actinocorallia aurantiaca TaxID=46204 RepID=A0ABP6GRX4_9ACTN
MERIEHTEITAGLWHLRPPRETEAADLLELAADPGVRLYTPKLNGVATEEQAREELRRWAAWEDRITFSILDSTTERYVGHVMVFGLDEVNAAAEIGYRVAPWARGRGAAGTAVRCVTGWAFSVLGLARLTLLHSVGNDASCRVAEKNGYLLEGVQRSQFRGGDGLLHDTHLHARLATD